MAAARDQTNAAILKSSSRRLLADPITPGKYAEIGPRRIRQHCYELQQVVVRVTEVDRSRRHPGEHNDLISWETGQISRLDSSFLQSRRRLMQIRERNLEGHVQT